MGAVGRKGAAEAADTVHMEHQAEEERRTVVAAVRAEGHQAGLEGVVDHNMAADPVAVVVHKEHWVAVVAGADQDNRAGAAVPVAAPGIGREQAVDPAKDRNCSRAAVGTEVVPVGTEVVLVGTAVR
jgi:hypothetical protein